uniref:Uncharacterized protein n=1 Tax=uncultured marine virus TaxID=186617 RepID=A0A0F7L386_9VIRU|nr:hypothetical protein [uncultured marine virus]
MQKDPGILRLHKVVNHGSANRVALGDQECDVPTARRCSVERAKRDHVGRIQRRSVVAHVSGDLPPVALGDHTGSVEVGIPARNVHMASAPVPDLAFRRIDANDVKLVLQGKLIPPKRSALFVNQIHSCDVLSRSQPDFLAQPLQRMLHSTV